MSNRGETILFFKTNLHNCSPSVLCFKLLAILTLLIGLNKLHNKNLLQNRSSKNLLLHSELQLQASRMRLSPNPSSINKSDLLFGNFFLKNTNKSGHISNPFKMQLMNHKTFSMFLSFVFHTSFPNPRMRFRSKDMSSLDSGSQTTQFAGGMRKRLQPRHHLCTNKKNEEGEKK